MPNFNMGNISGANVNIAGSQNIGAPNFEFFEVIENVFEVDGKKFVTLTVTPKMDKKAVRQADLTVVVSDGDDVVKVKREEE